MQNDVLAIVIPSVRLPGRHTLALCQNDSSYTITRSSRQDSPMTLVSSWLISPQNSKGNTGCEGAE